jgi:pimeloyl-ACP methyl ester carboxylesterase
MENVFHRWLKIPYTLHVTNFLNPKRPKATFILLHGIGGSANDWEDLIPLLPTNIRVIGIDLLGFGKSPKPTWTRYNAKTQARSVWLTLLKLRLFQQPTIVGHSLGGLVGIEIAKNYPLLVKQLILCSPPFYEQTEARRKVLKRDQLLRRLYRRVQKSPQTLEAFFPLIGKLKLSKKPMDVSEGKMESYLEALESSIVNQTALDDASQVRQPMTILYGTLDPVVIGSHIRKLAKGRENISVKTIATGHEITGRYTSLLAKEIGEMVAD